MLLTLPAAIAFAAGVLFLNESAQPSQFAGLLLILAGIALTQNRPPVRPA